MQTTVLLAAGRGPLGVQMGSARRSPQHDISRQIVRRNLVKNSVSSPILVPEEVWLQRQPTCPGRCGWSA